MTTRIDSMRLSEAFDPAARGRVRALRSETPRIRSMRFAPLALCAGLAIAFAAIVVASEATAQTAQVYASYTDVDPGPSAGPIGIGNTQGQVVYLWVDGGNIPTSNGPSCKPGASGDEVCGVALQFDGLDRFDFYFTPETNFNSGPGNVPFSVLPSGMTPTQQVRANGFDLGSPGIASRKLGTLTVFAAGMDTQTEANSQIRVSGNIVASNLELRGIAPATIIVPEPGFAAALVIGGGAIAWLRGRRKHPARRN